jgi:hypothetical protein
MVLDDLWSLLKGCFKDSNLIKGQVFDIQRLTLTYSTKCFRPLIPFTVNCGLIVTWFVISNWLTYLYNEYFDESSSSPAMRTDTTTP